MLDITPRSGLSEEQRLMRQSCRDFVDEVVTPFIRSNWQREWDMKPEARLPPEILQGAEEIGIRTLGVPEEFGGLELDPKSEVRTFALISEEISANVRTSLLGSSSRPPNSSGTPRVRIPISSAPCRISGGRRASGFMSHSRCQLERMKGVTTSSTKSRQLCRIRRCSSERPLLGVMSSMMIFPIVHYAALRLAKNSPMRSSARRMFSVEWA